MLTHVVLLQPKENILESSITTALNHVQELQEKIEGILEIKTGRNRSNYNQGYTYGFVIRFRNAEYLDAYATHPEHRVVSDELQSISRQIIDFDLE